MKIALSELINSEFSELSIYHSKYSYRAFGLFLNNVSDEENVLEFAGRIVGVAYETRLKIGNKLRDVYNTLVNIYPQEYKAIDDYLDNVRIYTEQSFDFYTKKMGSIIDDYLRNLERATPEEKLALVRKFSKAHNGVETLEYLWNIFPELEKLLPTILEVEPAAASFPTTAPQTWRDDKQPGETPPAFIKRIYGAWLGHGLDRATVRRLDPSLGQGLDNWLRKNTMPDDVDLPTPKERTEREVAALREQAGDRSVNDVLGDFTAREAGRLRNIISRHGRKQ